MYLTFSDYSKIGFDALQNSLSLLWAVTCSQPCAYLFGILRRITGSFSVTHQNHVGSHRAWAILARQWNNVIKGQYPLKALLMPTDCTRMLPVLAAKPLLFEGKGIRQIAAACPSSQDPVTCAFRMGFVPSAKTCPEFFRIRLAPCLVLFVTFFRIRFAPCFDSGAIRCGIDSIACIARCVYLGWMRLLPSPCSCNLLDRIRGVLLAALDLFTYFTMCFASGCIFPFSSQGKFWRWFLFTALTTFFCGYLRQGGTILLASHRMLLCSIGDQRHAPCYQQDHGAFFPAKYSRFPLPLHAERGV